MIIKFIIIIYGCLLFCNYCISDPPNVTVTPLLTIINETNMTTFTCTIFGIPVPNITWIRHRDGFESEIVDGLDDPNITTTVTGYTVTSILDFIKPLRDQEGIYECIGENGVTNVINVPETVNVTLFVQGVCYY